MSQSSERRKNFRAHSNFVFHLHHGIQPTRITAIDVSKRGLRCITHLPLKSGQQVILSPTDTPDLKLIGKVLASKQVAKGYEVRIRFNKPLKDTTLHPEIDRPHSISGEDKLVVGNLRFVFLSGTYEQRLAQYCSLLRDEIRSGPLERLASRNQQVLLESADPGRSALMQKILIKAYEYLIVPWLRRFVPRHHILGLKYLAKSSGLQFKTVLRAYLQPEGFMMLLRLGILRYFLPGIPLGGFPGCSSFVIQRSESHKKALIFGRNQDYPVIDSWEKYPVIAVHTPAYGQKYLTIGGAGVFFAAITGINESGIAIALHAHFGLEGRRTGESILSLTERILAEAHTLQDAIDLARGAKVNAAWSIFVVSREEMASCVIELSASRMHVRYQDSGMLCNTNVFCSKEMRQSEGVICGGTTEDFMGRFLRLQSMLGEIGTKNANARSALNILGDMTDYYSGEERVFGNTIGTIITIKSVVFDLLSEELYLGIRDRSPVSLGEYLKLPLDALWTKRGWKPVYLQPAKLSKSFLAATEAFRDAYMWWHANQPTRKNRQRAVSSMLKAFRIKQDDPHISFHLGNMLFKARRIKAARYFYEKTSKSNVTPHLVAVCKLQLARIFDLEGKRNDALTLYSMGRENIQDQRLARAFLSGCRRPYKKGMEKTMLLDLQFLDLMQY